MIDCDEDGPLSLLITKIWMDPHAGEVAVGRIYSGQVNREGVWALGSAKAGSTGLHDGWRRRYLYLLCCWLSLQSQGLECCRRSHSTRDPRPHPSKP